MSSFDQHQGGETRQAGDDIDGEVRGNQNASVGDLPCRRHNGILAGDWDAEAEHLLFDRTGAEPRCDHVYVILRESAEGGRPKDLLPRNARWTEILRPACSGTQNDRDIFCPGSTPRPPPLDSRLKIAEKQMGCTIAAKTLTTLSSPPVPCFLREILLSGIHPWPLPPCENPAPCR